MASPPNSGPNNRRRPQRFNARALRIEAPVDAEVLDVSEDGMGLISKDKLLVGCDYIFRVRKGSKTLSLPGRVEWCRLTGTTREENGDVVTVYRTGVALVDSPAAQAWRTALARATDVKNRQERSRGGAGWVTVAVPGSS